MRESIIKKKTIKILQFVNNTIPNLEQYCLPILKVLKFETCDMEAFLVFDMPNVKYLAFDTPNTCVYFMFHSRKLKS